MSQFENKQGRWTHEEDELLQAAMKVPSIIKRQTVKAVIIRLPERQTNTPKEVGPPTASIRDLSAILLVPYFSRVTCNLP
jgi:hypothetical protein